MSHSLFWLLVGRFLTGFCVGLLGPPGPIFISEISDPKHRGLFVGSISLAISLGIFLIHAFGIFLSWKMSAIICGVFPFISFILLAYVPESPPWLLLQGRLEEAADAFVWLRGHDEEAFREFELMVSGQRAATSGSPNSATNNISPSQWRRIIQEKPFYKPLLVMLCYFAIMQFSGINTIIFYTVTIVKEILGDQVNEYLATLLIDALRLGMSVVACFAMGRYGRRPLSLISNAGTIVCLLTLSLYLYIAEQSGQMQQFAYIPLTLLAGYIVFVSIGLNPLPWCMNGELFPLRYRSLGSAIVTFFNFFCFFTVIKTSPTLFATYGSEGTFLLFGILTLIGSIVLFIYLPETKNKSLQEIEDSYNSSSTSMMATASSKPNQNDQA